MIRITSTIATDATTREYFSNFSQSAANFLPEYFIGRQTKYSIFQGLLTGPGLIFDDYIELASDGANVNNILHAYRNEIPVFYDVELGQSWQFDYIKGIDRALNWVAPVVTGYFDDLSTVSLQVAEDNSIRSYRTSIPTRLDFNQYNLFPKSGLIFDGTVKFQKTLVNKWLYSDSYLFVTIVTDPVIVRTNQVLAKVCIIGRDYANKDLYEEIVITDSGQFKTSNKFMFIESVFMLDSEEEFDINIYDYPYNQLNYYFLEPRSNVHHRDIKNDAISLYYELGTDNYGQILRSFYFQDQDDQVTNYALQNKIFTNKYELIDTYGARVTGLISLLPSTYNSYLYGLTSSNLYIFDKKDEISSLFTEYNGFDPSPDAYLDVNFLSQSRSERYTGTGTVVGTSSTTLSDISKSWTVNELSGMGLVIGGFEYFIISNTSNTLTVSQRVTGFEFLDDVILAPTAYSIVSVESKLNPIRIMNSGETLSKPTRIQITIKHENSEEFYFDGTKFIETAPYWISNPRITPTDQFKYTEMTMHLPFTGNYLLTFTCEFQDSSQRYSHTFKNIYFIGNKKAIAQFSMSAIIAEGLTLRYLDSDLSEVRLVASRTGSINSIIDDTGVAVSDTFTNTIPRDIGIGITPGSMTFTVGTDTWADNVTDGVLTATGGNAVAGTIDYLTGAYVLNWTAGNKPVSTDIQVAYTYTEYLSQILDFKKDYMAVDFTGKIIHCFEKYDSVDVKTIDEINNPSIVLSTTGFPAVEDFSDGVW